MSKYFKIVLAFLSVIFFMTCDKQIERPKETILEGKTTILVDETLTPIIEDQVEIFESQYNATISLAPKSETEAVQALVEDQARIAILTRSLTKEEANVFKSKKITPKITKFAIDATALISNKNNNDTIVALQDVLDFMHGKPSKIRGLVFDDPNSSTARYIIELAGIDELPKEGVFSFGTNEQAIQYVAGHEGLIGIVGLNWIFQPSPAMRQFVDNVNVLSVKGTKGGDYIYPSQNDIGTRKYPLARDLYFVNCQGFAGLGMGFSSFVAGEVGQRIILKSGLVPAIMPARIISIRNDVINDKK